MKDSKKTSSAESKTTANAAEKKSVAKATKPAAEKKPAVKAAKPAAEKKPAAKATKTAAEKKPAAKTAKSAAEKKTAVKGVMKLNVSFAAKGIIHAATMEIYTTNAKHADLIKQKICDDPDAFSEYLNNYFK